MLNVDRLGWSDPIANEEGNGARMFRLLMTSFKKKNGLWLVCPWGCDNIIKQCAFIHVSPENITIDAVASENSV